MAGAQRQIRQAVEGIETWLAHSPHPGEAIVRQAIVLRLLHAAGFDIWNPAEVVPEETNATGHRSDFLIRAGSGKFALEIKGMNITLGAQQFQQASTYAVNEGTRWAIVTNGRVWIAIDEHLPGKWEQRVALKLELGQEGQTFSEDLAALLDAEMWRADGFAGAVQVIRSRQQQRLDEARIRREKTAVVQEIQVKYGISTFALAADAAVRMNELTEAERDVLLGVPVQQSKAKPLPVPFPIVEDSEGGAEEIHFTYQIHGAEAHAVYNPPDGNWTVKAGSTALNRVLGEGGTNATGVKGRRQSYFDSGQLIEKSPELLEYVTDVIYTSASTPAIDIAGASRNGWECWKDSEGRPAQYHRSKPKSQPT
ncbi:DUF4357 domain-containing protein [Deinococcus arenicola]|uniref:DUF4357 domain-containing protein n=1 Tax=Deinococcus arenicola TaxID=2994950 RepID=A0ABU4DM90_9DEIO|nr:DUF4357 domain-containing protein [Deinococcus sp. ZS9-10]MDV6373555.1 DUF4357 domain-containing protein [Deinococcus sp. ZS9-10]